VGAAGLVQLDGRNAAPGGALELSAAPRRWPVWPALTVVATRPESHSLAGGDVRWMRVRLASGATYQRRLGRVALRVQADLWQAAVVVGGTGFTSSRQAAGYDLGLGGAVTLALPVWREAGGSLPPGPLRHGLGQRLVAVPGAAGAVGEPGAAGHPRPAPVRRPDPAGGGIRSAVTDF
jgi:hypothetical protein